MSRSPRCDIPPSPQARGSGIGITHWLAVCTCHNSGPRQGLPVFVLADGLDSRGRSRRERATTTAAAGERRLGGDKTSLWRETLDVLLLGLCMVGRARVLGRQHLVGHVHEWGGKAGLCSSRATRGFK